VSGNGALTVSSEFRNFDRQITQLAAEGRFGEAEALLLQRYEKVRGRANQKEIEEMLLSLGHFYNLKGDFRSAEKYFLELEQISRFPSKAKYITAFFYSFGPEEYRKALAKLNEISTEPEKGNTRRDQYAALHLKGRVLLKLNETDLASQILDQLIQALSSASETELRVELEFVEELIQQHQALNQCRTFLTLARPLIRDKEYANKAESLLNRLPSGPNSQGI
jgi:hypothetical protein